MADNSLSVGRDHVFKESRLFAWRTQNVSFLWFPPVVIGAADSDQKPEPDKAGQIAV